MIVFDKYGFRYDAANKKEWALKDISIEIKKGEIALALGRSGCGKSTLGLAAAGIVPHLLTGEVEGKVISAGKDVLETSMFEMSKYVGVVFQDPEVQLFALTIEDEVAMSLESYGTPPKEIRERVDWALSVCGLSGMEMRAPAKLSGGQKQRVAIAAVIARDPDILVFDEPTGNLDPIGTRSVYKVIKRICTEKERTVLLIEHDLAPVIDFIDRVFVLDGGRIIFQGEPREALAELDLMHKAGAKVPVATEFGIAMENRGLVRYDLLPLNPEEAVIPLDKEHIAAGMNYLKNLQEATPKSNDDKIKKEPLIKFQAVTHEYATGTVALDNISLEIQPGEFVGIVGMNGAGKTTLALHVMGILTPTKGEINVGGYNTREMSVAEMARTTGLIFQNPNHQLFKENIKKELRFGPENLGWDEEQIEKSMEMVLQLVDLNRLEEADPESISTGQKKRVAIASTLIMNPKILLLDEPTTGQDQRTLEPILELVSHLHKDGMTVLMITHDMEVAMKYSDRIIILANGKIIADGPPEEVFPHQDILIQAGLYTPELLQLTSALNNGKPIWASSLKDLEIAFSIDKHLEI